MCSSAKHGFHLPIIAFRPAPAAPQSSPIVVTRTARGYERQEWQSYNGSIEHHRCEVIHVTVEGGLNPGVRLRTKAKGS